MSTNILLKFKIKLTKTSKLPLPSKVLTTLPSHHHLTNTSKLKPHSMELLRRVPLEANSTAPFKVF